jgi:hypothetical protein
MEELLKICKTMLDNANLDIAIEVPSSTIILDFVVGGSLENVVLRCSDYTRLRVAKSADDDRCFFVGETHIEMVDLETSIREFYAEDGWRSIGDTRISPMFRVRCDGGILLDIVCGTLAWKIDDSEFQTVPLPAIVP